MLDMFACDSHTWLLCSFVHWFNRWRSMSEMMTAKWMKMAHWIFVISPANTNINYIHIKTQYKCVHFTRHKRETFLNIEVALSFPHWPISYTWFVYKVISCLFWSLFISDRLLMCISYQCVWWTRAYMILWKVCFFHFFSFRSCHFYFGHKKVFYVRIFRFYCNYVLDACGVVDIWSWLCVLFFCPNNSCLLDELFGWLCFCYFIYMCSFFCFFFVQLVAHDIV